MRLLITIYGSITRRLFPPRRSFLSALPRSFTRSFSTMDLSKASSEPVRVSLESKQQSATNASLTKVRRVWMLAPQNLLLRMCTTTHMLRRPSSFKGCIGITRA